jgi:outer membrane immunogenic protein
MKRVLVAGLFALASVGVALAADLPQPAPPPPQAPAAYIPTPAPVYNWGGIYVGINGGYGFGNTEWTLPSGVSNSASANGGVVGGTLGFNYQFNALVVGVEGDFDYSGINSSTVTTICGVTGNCQTGNTWLSTIRGRFGFAADRVLFYGTAGGVFGNEQITNAGVTNTKTQMGWTVGAGVEAAFADNWTAKIEYLYADLGTETCTTACGGVPISVSLTDNLVRAGVNYKFNF